MIYLIDNTGYFIFDDRLFILLINALSK